MGILEEIESISDELSKNDEEKEQATDDVVDKAIEDTEKEEVEEEVEQESEAENDDDEGDDEVDESEGTEEEEPEDEEDDPKKRASRGWKERKKMRELKQKLDDAEQRVARLEGNVEGRQAAQSYNNGVTEQQAAQAAQDADPEPDKELYNEEWLEWKMRDQSNVINNLSQQMQQSNYNSQLAAARSEMTRFESSFAKTNPNYHASKEFLRQAEAKILRMENPNATDAQINQHLDNRELEIGSWAANNGRDPAGAIYEYATIRGYTFDENVPAKKSGPNLEAVKKNKRKSASLMSGAAARKRDGVTSEEIVDMTMADKLNMSRAAWKPTD